MPIFGAMCHQKCLDKAGGKCVDEQVLRLHENDGDLFRTGTSTGTLESSEKMNKEIH